MGLKQSSGMRFGRTNWESDVITFIHFSVLYTEVSNSRLLTVLRVINLSLRCTRASPDMHLKANTASLKYNWSLTGNQFNDLSIGLLKPTIVDLLEVD